MVDKAIELNHFGGTFGGNQQPTQFLCLLLKMLQIQPEKEIVVEYIKNEDYKCCVNTKDEINLQFIFLFCRYVRLLGAFYLRLVGKPFDIYQYLEPLYHDYRKCRKRALEGDRIDRASHPPAERKSFF